MLNEMICFRCKDVVVTSATSVELPFMCEECTEAVNFQEQIAPTGGLTPAPEPPPLSDHDTATVENTTLLIDDLEQQVANTDAALKTSMELIEDLTQQLAKAKENLKLYDEAGRTVTELLIATTKERNELGMRVFRLTSFNKYLGSALLHSRERTKKYYDRGLESWKKSYFYENLSFWGRLFNHRYSGKLVDPRGF